MNNLHLPIYPLPIFILPGGMTRLRIFEQRHLTMIKIASKDNGFVITSHNLNIQDRSKITQQSNAWGSWVNIINFELGDDGILEIDVKCKSLVRLLSIEKNENNLNFSTIKISPHWSQNTEGDVNNSLLNSLSSVFEQSHLIKYLYRNDMTDNTNWLVARWLEILPLSLEVKVLFSKFDTFQIAQEFVNSIVLLNKKQLKQLKR